MKLSAFSVNTIFVVLMLLGISLIPVLSLQLLPSSRSNDLSVSFSWDNAGPELLEMEVTTKLEGLWRGREGYGKLFRRPGMAGEQSGFLSIKKKISMPLNCIWGLSSVR